MIQKFIVVFFIFSAAATAHADEFIVRFKDHSRSQQNLQLLKEADLQITNEIPQLDIFVVDTEAGHPALETLRSHAEVLYVVKNVQIQLADTKPNDSSYKKQWHHKNIASEKAWDKTTGSNHVVVAVIDTGASLNHPDLKNNIWVNTKEIPANNIDDDQNGYVDDVKGWDFANKDNNPEDGHSHGSHCSGLVGAEGNNKTGVTGVNWKVKIMPLQFFKANGAANDADGAKAIVYAADNGAKIISASWGAEEPTKSIEDAIIYASQKGVLFVAAAGNNKSQADRKRFYPSGYYLPNIVSVGASTSNNGVAEFSNYGLHSVHVASPGLNIFSTSLKATYETMSGTSMATPIVAGVAALTLAAQPDLSMKDLRNAVLNAVVANKNWKSKAATGGIIQASTAVLQLAGGSQVWPKTMRIKEGTTLPMTAYKAARPVWSSANNSVATVDSSGVVKGIAPGITQVSFLDDAGAVRAASIEVVK